MRAWFAVCAALLTALAVTRVGHATPLTELAERVRPSVVLVTLYDSAGHKLGSGSAFFVSESGWAVTNVHVIDEGSRATVTLADGRELDVDGVLAQNADDDVAVVRVHGGPFAALPLGQSTTLAIGADVVVLGSPLGLSASLSTGIVAALRDGGLPEDVRGARKDFGGSWNVQITAPISPGNSGSPVMTPDGNVVAVAVGTHRAGENVNFAVPIERVKVLLAGLGPSSPVQPLAGEPVRSEVGKNLAISAGAFAGMAIAYVVWSRWGRRGRAARRRAD